MIQIDRDMKQDLTAGNAVRISCKRPPIPVLPPKDGILSTATVSPRLQASASVHNRLYNKLFNYSIQPRSARMHSLNHDTVFAASEQQMADSETRLKGQKRGQNQLRGPYDHRS
jgi:hypothetical protein